MTYNQHRRVTCPLCERGEMAQIHPFLARCTRCMRTMSYGFFNTLRQIGNLLEATGEHPCECGHPEMRRLPDGVYRCPSCGSEVVYPTYEDKESSERTGQPVPRKPEHQAQRAEEK